MISYRTEIEPLTPYVPGRPAEDVKKEFGLTHVVKIASNENPLGCSKKVKDALMSCFDNIPVYPDGNCTILRKALSRFLNVSENTLSFGAGADEVIANICKAYISSGDQCITGEATFSQYAAGAISMGAEMIYVPLKNHGFDLDKIKVSITDKTKIIFVANPNNPTGTAFSHDELVSFMDAIPPKVIMVLDEAYGEFADKELYPRSLELLDKYKNLIILKTFSKVYGLASLRVGYGIADAEIVSAIERIRCPFNVSTIAQMAAAAALSDAEFVSHSVSANTEIRAYVTSELESLGVYCIPSHANFIMADFKADSKNLSYQLMKKGYIVRPGVAFGMDTFLRISIGTQEQMTGFIIALKEVLNK